MGKRKIFDYVLDKQMKEDEKKQEEIKEEARKDVARHSLIAKKILRIVVDADLEIGEIDVIKSRPEAYAKVAAQIMQLFLDEDIRFIDKDFPFQLALQPLTFVQNIVNKDLMRSYSLAQAAAMGCEDMQEVTMSTVDRVWRELQDKKESAKVPSEPKAIGESTS